MVTGIEVDQKASLHNFRNRISMRLHFATQYLKIANAVGCVQTLGLPKFNGIFFICAGPTAAVLLQGS